MRRAFKYWPPGTWHGEPSSELTLAFADRHRRRVVLEDDLGDPFLLDLPHATHLEHDGALQVDSSEWIRIRAAAEQVTDIRCRTAEHTLRLAWHIGNRHAPLEVIDQKHLRILANPVLEQMLLGLGAEILRTQGPFRAETGAYSQGHHHEHASD